MALRRKIKAPDSSDESDVDEAQTADWMMDLHAQGHEEDEDEDEGEKDQTADHGVLVDEISVPTRSWRPLGTPNGAQNRPPGRPLSQSPAANARSSSQSLPSAASQSHPHREWMIPLGVPPERLFGKNGSILHDIEQQTNTYMKANYQPPAVFLWGTEEQINEAVRSLETRASHLLDELRASHRKTAGWAKPEKLEKNKRKEPKKGKTNYHGTPPPNPICTGAFILPMMTWPKWLKVADKTVQKLREDTHCWIFHEDGEDGGLMRVVGEKPVDVEVALSRLKNLYIQRTLKMKLSDRILFMCPTEGPNTVVKFAKASSDKVKYLNFRSHSELMVLQTVPTEDAPANLAEVPITTDQMEENYLSDLSDCLKDALEETRLWQGQTRLRISFGHIIYTDYPEPAKYPAWRAGRIAARVFPNAAFKARFIYLLTEREHQAEQFIKFLDNSCAEYMDNPRDTFELLCCNREGASQCDKALREGMELPPQYECSRIVASFRKEDGKLATWNAENLGQNVLVVQHTNTNSPLDWKLEMETSIPLAADSRTPHGILSWNLRLHSDRSRGDRLIFHHTSSLAILQISRRRTWSYGHRDWIISVIRVDEWAPVTPGSSRGDAAGNLDPQCTLKETPLRSSVTVQLQHRVWDEMLSSQLKLGPGEPARWDAEAIAGRDACKEILSEVKYLDDEIRRYMDLKI